MLTNHLTVTFPIAEIVVDPVPEIVPNFSARFLAFSLSIVIMGFFCPTEALTVVFVSGKTAPNFCCRNCVLLITGIASEASLTIFSPGAGDTIGTCFVFVGLVGIAFGTDGGALSALSSA